MDGGVRMEFISLEERERIKKQIGELKLDRNWEGWEGGEDERENKCYEAYRIIYRIYRITFCNLLWIAICFYNR